MLIHSSIYFPWNEYESDLEHRISHESKKLYEKNMIIYFLKLFKALSAWKILCKSLVLTIKNNKIMDIAYTKCR